MSQSRISCASGTSHSSRSSRQNKLKDKLKIDRYIGVSLSGGKSENTAVVVLDFYPYQRKLFLTHIYEHVKPSNEDTSYDEALLDILDEHKKLVKFAAFDAPLELPHSLSCQCRSRTAKGCNHKEVQWMWKEFRKIRRKKPKAKLFTSYTTRACEMYVNAEFEEDEIHALDALGANHAPLTARMQFLKPRLKGIKLLEVQPRLSVWRVGKALKIMPSHLRHYKHSIDGVESRQVILQSLVKHDLAFIYESDMHRLVENVHVFDAFMAGLTAHLKARGQTEKPPKDFPNQTGWIEIPVNEPEFF